MIPLLLSILLSFMIAFPAQSLDASKSGLLLWFDTLLPTLLPFLIISQLIMKTETIDFMERMAGIVLSRLFHCSPKGGFCILCGFLCGYPIGARLITLALQDGELDIDEAQYLLPICNNVSPMFCISYGISKVIGTENMLPYLLIIYGSPLVYGMITRPVKYSQNFISKKEQTSKTESIFQLMDVCIIDSFLIMIKICGYLIIFSLISRCLLCIIPKYPMLATAVSCILEITSGLSMVSTFQNSFLKELFCIHTLAFGGICCMMQIHSIIHTTNLSLKKYVYSKIVITLFAAALFFCLKFIFH